MHLPLVIDYFKEFEMDSLHKQSYQIYQILKFTLYQGKVLYVREVKKQKISITRKVLIEIQQASFFLIYFLWYLIYTMQGVYFYQIL